MTDTWGDFSNMAKGMPLVVAGIQIGRSENLYQACRYPHIPKLQKDLIEESNPMTAKFLSKRNYDKSRQDWDDVCVDVMRWCLHVKLKQNWGRMTNVMAQSGSKDIVEESARTDQFWGTVEAKGESDILIGHNILGRLWVEIRDEINSGVRTASTPIPPLPIVTFELLGHPIPVL
jgi:ribA/ribD-fused uncharacterized protein